MVKTRNNVYKKVPTVKTDAVQVAKEVWVCDKGITKWASSIREYKDSLKKAMAVAANGE